MKQPLISIVIPIYNVEQYLSTCLDSIVHQTYTHLEIILVNDGSTDTSPAICDAYAQKDERIMVIHKDNSGSAAARNDGLKVAKGECIAFVDSDDVIAKDFYEILLTVLLDNNADIVECGYCNFETESELKKCNNELQTSCEFFETQNALELLMKEYLKQVVWNKLYHRTVLRGVDFPVGKFIDDEFWTYKVFGNARRIVKISTILYFYRQLPDSIMGRAYSLRRLDALQALEERIYYMKNQFPALENLAIKIFCMGSLWHYQKIEKHSKIDPEKLYRNKIKKNVEAYNKLSILKYWSLKEIIWCQFFLVAPQYYARLRNYIKVGI